MRITGRDYTDEDLIAPWDQARTQRRPNGPRDDPDPDNDRDDDFDNGEPPVGEGKP